METDKKVGFLEFKDLVINRANNLIFCFDGTITTLREESSKEFFFKQTFSLMYSVKNFKKCMENKAEKDKTCQSKTIFKVLNDNTETTELNVSKN